MNPENDDRDALQPHCFDPFPKPQTIPAGWDTDAILSTPIIAAAQEADSIIENESH